MKKQYNKNAKNVIHYDLMEYIGIIYKYWKLILLTGLIITCFISLYVFLLPPKYKAKAILITGEAKDFSSLESIAAQLGIVNLNESLLDSPEIYVEIIKSRNFLEAVAQKKYPVSNRDTLTSLIKIYNIKEYSKNIRRSRDIIAYLLYKKLVQSIKVETDIKTPIIKIYCETIDPQLSAAILTTIIKELDNFNNQVRNIKAEKNLQFIEKRLNQTREELARAEEVLQQFRKKNKRIHDSPDLQLQLGRLMREITIQEEIFIMLSKEYELAKIEEIKEAPIIDIIEKPIPPIYKIYPKRLKTIIIFGFLAFLIGLALALIVEYVKNEDLINKIKMKLE